MSNDPGDIECQLRERVQRLLAQLAHDAAQLETAGKHPYQLDAAELQHGRCAAQAVAKALQDMGNFGNNTDQ